MYQVFKNTSLKQLILLEFPVFAVALFLAETFYKFGSFTLECIAFVATWLALSYVLHLLVVNRKKTGKP